MHTLASPQSESHSYRICAYCVLLPVWCAKVVAFCKTIAYFRRWTSFTFLLLLYLVLSPLFLPILVFFLILLQLFSLSLSPSLKCPVHIIELHIPKCISIGTIQFEIQFIAAFHCTKRINRKILSKIDIPGQHEFDIAAMLNGKEFSIAIFIVENMQEFGSSMQKNPAETSIITKQLQLMGIFLPDEFFP